MTLLVGTPTLSLIGGKWKGVIVYHLLDGPLRFSQVKRHLPGVTQRMLTKQLRELEAAGIPCRRINKVTEGRPHVVDMLKNGEISFIINTTEGKQAQQDSFSIRRSALQGKVYYTTTLSGAEAVCQSLRSQDALTVRRLQDLHTGLASA